MERKWRFKEPSISTGEETGADRDMYKRMREGGGKGDTIQNVIQMKSGRKKTGEEMPKKQERRKRTLKKNKGWRR